MCSSTIEGVCVCDCFFIQPLRGGGGGWLRCVSDGTAWKKTGHFNSENYHSFIYHHDLQRLFCKFCPKTTSPLSMSKNNIECSLVWTSTQTKMQNKTMHLSPTKSMSLLYTFVTIGALSAQLSAIADDEEEEEEAP